LSNRLTPAGQARFDQEIARQKTETDDVDEWIDAQLERTGLGAAIETGTVTEAEATAAIESMMSGPDFPVSLSRREAERAARAWRAATGRWPDESDDTARAVAAAWASATGAGRPHHGPGQAGPGE